MALLTATQQPAGTAVWPVQGSGISSMQQLSSEAMALSIDPVLGSQAVPLPSIGLASMQQSGGTGMPLLHGTSTAGFGQLGSGALPLPGASLAGAQQLGSAGMSLVQDVALASLEQLMGGSGPGGPQRQLSGAMMPLLGNVWGMGLPSLQPVGAPNAGLNPTAAAKHAQWRELKRSQQALRIGAVAVAQPPAKRPSGVKTPKMCSTCHQPVKSATKGVPGTCTCRQQQQGQQQ